MKSITMHHMARSDLILTNLSLGNVHKYNVVAVNR